MAKRLFSICLMLILIVTNMPIAYAAGTEQEAMSKVHLYAKGTGTQLLTYKGEIHPDFAPAMVMYTAADGSELPAYCINPNKPGVEENPSKSYDVNADTPIQYAKAWGCVMNGYPYKTPAELGLNSEYEAYYSTKMALWCIMHDNYSNINDWSANGENNQKVMNAMKAIYQAGMNTNSIPQGSNVTVTPTTEKAEDDEKDNSCLSQTFTVLSTGSFSVALDSTAPMGTKITDEQNNNKTTFNQGEKFKILIPKTYTKTSGSFNISINADSNAKVILYGSSFNVNTQDYAVTTQKPIGGTTKATVTYMEDDGDKTTETTTETTTEVETTPTPTPTPSTPGTLKIVKVKAGTTTGLAGAIFRVTDADGGIVGDFITNGNGQVTVPLESIGAYYVDEIEAPAGYQIDENSHKDVIVTKDEQAVLTFANKPNTDLTITKIDADTGEKLPKATIRVALDGGNNFQDVTTDGTGTARVNNMPDGTYTVTEITAPNGYILDETPHSIKIESGKEAAITLKNKAKPGILIKKYDEGTGMPLAGAEFSVKKKDGSIVYEGITGKDGTIKIEDLEPDWYTITEIAPPPGYLITTESKDVKLEANKVTEVKFDNRLRPALQIMKVDSQTNEPLKGAKFYVKKADGETVSEYITDASGTVTINNLDEAVYTVWEFESPEGYLLDTTHKDIQLEWGKTKQLVFTNKAKPSLEILKIDEETKKPLEGAKFRITQTENKTTSEYVTDKDGRILITDLEDKIYTVEEIVAPAGYLLENQHKDIQLEWGKTKQLVFTNKAKPSLEILKIDEETKKPLEGAKFRITQTENNTTSEYVTDKDGRIFITDLEDKIYTVEEIVAPKGYLLENQHKDIQLEWGKTKQLVFTNKAKPKLRILKVDVTTGQPLKNAEFRVTKVEDKTVNEYITDENGEILIENLDEAIYKVEEFMPPDGYDLYTESKEISLEWGKTKTLKFDNIRKPVLVFLKSNGLTGKPVKGATFKVEYEMADGGVKTIGSYKTDENGQIIIPKVNVGWYILTETMPASGYSLPSNPVTRLYVDKGDNAYLDETNKYYQSSVSTNVSSLVSNAIQSITSVVTQNKDVEDKIQVSAVKAEYSSGSDYYLQGEGWNWPLNSIVIKKTDAVTGELLEGASFEVYRADEQVSGVPGTNIGRYTTDNSGVVVITGLEAGYYVVKEVKAPQNYLISENSQQNGFLKTDGTTVLEFTFANYPYGSILITKVDGVTKKPLANAKFKVTDSSGAAVGSGEYTTNIKGEILIGNVKPGSYVVTEVQAPENYVMGNASKTVEVGTDGKTYTLPFENYPYGAILISKIDGVTKAPLANAKFKITDNSGKAVGNSNGEYTTNSKGEILINNVAPGNYVVTEIQAPDNYAVDDVPKTLEVGTDGKTYTLSFDNYPYSTILISKIDGVTKEPLANAKFKVTDSDEKPVGNSNGEYTTNSKGEILIGNVKPGTYIVTEIQAPDNYAVDPTPKTVKVEANGGTNKLTFDNYPYGAILITKVDGITKAPLANAKFKVTDNSGKAIGNSNGEYTTNSKGEILINNIAPGNYVITEIQAPDNYAVNDTPKTVEVGTDGKTYKLSFDNYPYGTLIIKKLDTVSKEPLANAEFKVMTSKGDVVGEKNGIFTTNEKGVITIPNLPKGSYVVEETKAPKGYVLENKAETVEIEYGKTYTLEVFNNKKSGLQIIKIDSNTKQPLKHAEFKVYKKSGKEIGKYETDADGVIIIDNLSPGWIKIVETKAPDGYLLDETPKDVEITSNQFVKVTFENNPMSSLIIKKYDTATKEPLAGAVFKITKKSGDIVGEYKTNDKGLIQIDNLETGWYSAVEIKAPNGYKIAETAKDFEVTHTKTVTLEFPNEKLTSLIIKKVNDKTGEPLAGAKFTIEKQNGEKIYTNENGTDFVTDAQGFINIPNLAPDYYIVKEIKAPENYILDETPKTVQVKTDTPTVVTFANKPLAGLKIVKLNSVTKEPIAGVEFSISKMNGEKVVNDKNGYTFTTDRNGQIYIPNLDDGVYYVTETKAADDYFIDKEPKTIEIKSGKATVLEVLNQPCSGLLIVKTDANTGEPLAGVVFDIKKANGERVTSSIIDQNQPNTENNSPNKNTTTWSVLLPDGKSRLRRPHIFAVPGDISGSYVTDKNGRIRINNLAPGEYHVIETQALDGYILDTDVHSVTVTDGKQATLRLTNTQKAGIRIVKVDSITKAPIYNVEFMVFDANNKVVGTYYTDNNGVIDLPAELPEGRYTIRETRAADGYYLDEMPKTVDFKAGQVTEIVWTNTPQMGQIQLTKLSADDNEVNGLPAGTPLEGAVFEVYAHKSGNLVDRFVSGSDGKAVSNPLPIGRYTVKEVKAPANYRLSDKQLDIEIEFPTQIIKQEFLNYSANTGVHIKKTGNVEATPNSIICYDIKAVQNTSSVPLTDFYWRDVVPTDAGRVTKIVTGTYNQSLKYKIMVTTNKGNTKVIADNLSTIQNNVVGCTNAEIGLANDEYVTSFSLMFGTVKAGFAQVEQPQVYMYVQKNLPNGYQFANKADIGGKYQGEWVIGNSTWLTTIYAVGGKLPKTGY